MEEIQTFCRQIRARSVNHKVAIQALVAENLPDQIVSILRQELDSMIRVMYLLSIDDMNYRLELIKASVSGKTWTIKGTRKRITDREMVELANRLEHWAEYVYKFGCAFIHLSNFHDYRNRDPMKMISEDERKSILNYMHKYHCGPLGEKFSDLISYLPRVFKKISSNLECYIKQLENNECLDQLKK